VSSANESNTIQLRQACTSSSSSSIVHARQRTYFEDSSSSATWHNAYCVGENVVFQ
jgi:hypothetical protein